MRKIGYISILSFFIIYLVAAQERGFKENCYTWDSNKWDYEYNRPTVVDGTWVFTFPSEGNKTIHVYRRKTTGYGEYKIRMKTSGPRVPGINYYMFLYMENPHNELDAPEFYGAHESNVLSISTHRDGFHDYWYFTSDEPWEDGKYHEWKLNYAAERLEFYLDETLLFSYDENMTYPVLAEPPMYLYVGGNVKGNQNSGFTFIIDNIEYKPN